MNSLFSYLLRAKLMWMFSRAHNAAGEAKYLSFMVAALALHARSSEQGGICTHSPAKECSDSCYVRMKSFCETPRPCDLTQGIVNQTGLKSPV